MYQTNPTYNDIWQNCLAQIKTRTSEVDFNKWFEPIVPIGFDGTTLKLKVPNESYAIHIERNFIPFLTPIIREMFGQQTRLRYAIPSSNQNTTNTNLAANADVTAISEFVQSSTPDIKNPFVIPGIKKVQINPQLNPSYSFDTFIEGVCNRLARSAGYAVALNPGNTAFNPLYIYGNSGLGKTHIAQAIGLEVKQRRPDKQVLYVSMNRFQAQFQNAAIKGELNDFIHFYQMIDVLIIDDIQEIAGKEKTQNAFFNIFNHLHLSNKQLIITSDKPPVELKDIEQRLLTRFKWGLSTELELPDLDTKIKIIKNKVAAMNMEINDDVVTFLAQSINANVREIEGALSSLSANASFLGKKITISLAKEILKIYVKYSQKEVSIDQIQSIVCENMNVTLEQINSTKRTRNIAQARQVAMYLSKAYTNAPLTAIGAAIGGKNHATVLHACKTVSNLMETDRAFRNQIEQMQKLLRE